MTSDITPKQRMLAAYRGEKLDRVPVAPEFWYYIPARLLGMDMIQIHRDIPHWKALQKTFRHYQCEGWGIVSPAPPDGPFETRSEQIAGDNGQFETRHVTRTPAGELISRRRFHPDDPPWSVERPIKDFGKHWPVYAESALLEPGEYDWRPVQKALEGVGEDYLLEVFIGNPFTDFVGGPREGDFAQMVLDLQEHGDYLRDLRNRYVEHRCQLIRDALTRTAAESVFIGCSWSCGSLIGPRLWREWDRPVLAAFTDAAHRAGGLIHVHCHGDCAELVPDFAQMGVDCLCPLERPPGGDVTQENMRDIKDITRHRTTLNGNVHTVETLIRGKPDDVRNEVRQIIDMWAEDGRLVVGTGDQVGRETPEENIATMIDTAKSYGHYD